MNVCLHCQFTAPDKGTFCPSCGTSLQAGSSPTDDLTGQEIAQRYTIHRTIATRPDHDLYLVKHKELDQMRVLQRFKGTTSLTEPSRGLLSTLKKLCECSQQNQFIAVYYEAEFVDSFGHFVAREYLNGTPLSSLLHPGNRLLGASRVCAILLQVASALQTLHDAKLIFNGLRPENIMLLENQGQKGKIKLLNPGLDRPLNELHSDPTPPQLMGPSLYLAPEQLFPFAENKARGWMLNHSLDVYALGALAYKMLTGRVPYRRKQSDLTTEDWASWRSAIQAPPPPLDEATARPIPKALNDAVMRALQANPSDRFPSATAFAEAILSAARELEPIDIAAMVPTDAPGTIPSKDQPKSIDLSKQTGEYPLVTERRVKVTESGDPEDKEARIDKFAPTEDAAEDAAPSELPPLPSSIAGDNLQEVLTWSALFEEQDSGILEHYGADESTDSFQADQLKQAAEAVEAGQPAAAATPSTKAPEPSAKAPPPAPASAPTKPANGPPPAPVVTPAASPAPQAAPAPFAPLPPLSQSSSSMPGLAAPFPGVPGAAQQAPLAATAPQAAPFPKSPAQNGAPPVGAPAQASSPAPIQALDDALGNDEVWVPPEKSNKKPIVLLALIGGVFLVGGFFFLSSDKKPDPAPGKRQAARTKAPARAPSKALTGASTRTPAPRPRIDSPAPRPRTRMDFSMGSSPQPPRRVVDPTPPPVVRRRKVEPPPVVRRRRRIVRRRVIRRRPPRRRRRSRSACPTPSSPSMRYIRLRSRGLSLRKVDVRVRGKLLRPKARGCVQIPVTARMMMLSYRPDVTAYHLCQVRLSSGRKYYRFKLVDANTVPPANSDCSK